MLRRTQSEIEGVRARERHIYRNRKDKRARELGSNMATDPCAVWLGNVPHGLPQSALYRLCAEYELAVPVSIVVKNRGSVLDGRDASAVLTFGTSNEASDALCLTGAVPVPGCKPLLARLAKAFVP